ncbi:response regulator [Nonomuraea sp. FMUSA5-5]|uniref:Response regulator n=1 Tax=Nonomuraea composti TaxID=2720023 RepID=A0ABX1BEI9_9ACTN|nr:response regulator [Nonomuraea sp. FMUSA5-5]
MEVVAAVSDGAEAVSVARRLRPDVCLLDITMPKLDRLEVTRVLARPGWTTRGDGHRHHVSPSARHCPPYEDGTDAEGSNCYRVRRWS